MFQGLRESEQTRFYAFISWISPRVAGVREEFQTAFSRGSPGSFTVPRDIPYLGVSPSGPGASGLRFALVGFRRLAFGDPSPPDAKSRRRAESRHPGVPGRHAPRFSVTSKTKRCRPPGDDFSRRLQAAFKDWGLKLRPRSMGARTPETGREATAYPAPAPRPSLSPRTCEGRERGPRGRGKIRNP